MRAMPSSNTRYTTNDTDYYRYEYRNGRYMDRRSESTADSHNTVEPQYARNSEQGHTDNGGHPGGLIDRNDYSYYYDHANASHLSTRGSTNERGLEEDEEYYTYAETGEDPRTAEPLRWADVNNNNTTSSSSQGTRTRINSEDLAYMGAGVGSPGSYPARISTPILSASDRREGNREGHDGNIPDSRGAQYRPTRGQCDLAFWPTLGLSTVHPSAIL
ncbi:MAG: hypothetical protein M1831_005665 [Alyxoria varia]|nr:MAG: hypothetical protein M1831_005665 [Alyxoria varia]